MNNDIFPSYRIDYVEICTPMAKMLAYWHVHALGFTISAVMEADPANPGKVSYVIESNDIRLVLSSVHPFGNNHFGVKRIALHVDSVEEAFQKSVNHGAFPVKFPTTVQDGYGFISEAGIKLYDHNEIIFINRDGYSESFRPGYRNLQTARPAKDPFLFAIDHIAAELRINESAFWTKYLGDAIGTRQVQNIKMSNENKTGMILNISQSPDRRLTLVIAEPEGYLNKSKMQNNIDTFGPGIHHLAFTTDDMTRTVRELKNRNVEFVGFPASYYDLLRQNEDFKDIDIDSLQQCGILIDKEGDSFLLQKFLKPSGDRPFFFYELVQRVNGYNGFALKNINLLKKAEEMEIIK